MENRGSKDDKVSREIWKAVETSAEEIRVGEAEERRNKGRSRKEEREKGKEEETEKGKDGGSKENSGGVRNLE